VNESEGKNHTFSMNMTYVTIYGNVTEKGTDDPIQDATVTVTGNECNCSFTATTDDMGYYDIDFNVEGNFTVKAEKAGYESEEKNTYATHHDPTSVNFHLQKVITKVHGYVIEGGSREPGSEINDARVHIQSTHETYTVYSLLTGYYDQELMDGGEFTITVSKEDYFTEQKTVTIQTGEENQVDFILEKVQDSKPPKEKYGVEVNASNTKLDLEGKDVTVVTFTVMNIGEEEDSYTLIITGTFRGWTATMDSSDAITLQPGAMKSISLTLNESLTESPDGDSIVVDVTAISQTYPEVQDSVRIEGKLEGDDVGIPDLTVPLIVVSIGGGALVAYFRRRY